MKGIWTRMNLFAKILTVMSLIVIVMNLVLSVQFIINIVGMFSENGDGKFVFSQMQSIFTLITVTIMLISFIRNTGKKNKEIEE